MKTLPWSFLAFILLASNICKVESVGRRRALIRPVHPFVLFNGGGQSSSQEEEEKEEKNVTLALERYVATMEEQDKAKDDSEQAADKDDEADDGTGTSSSNARSASNNDKDPSFNNENDDAAVGVKHHGKKSNAVGDPDGNSSDSDDEDTDTSEWEEFLEEMQELGLDAPPPVQQHETKKEPRSAEMQVEMELVNDLEDDDDSNSITSSATSGNVGVRLANRLAGRRNTGTQQSLVTSSKAPKTRSRSHEAALVEAWLPHVYLPLSDDGRYLEKHARSMDAASKSRLDRRTLYGSLLLEWQHQLPSSRKFLDASTAQQLQAALSLATQPKWRKSFPQANCISIQDDSTTLAMQETIAMAMAHSLGCGMVILDDSVLDSVRQELQKDSEDNVDEKPASLLKSLLQLANEGKLSTSPSIKSGSIAAVMERELDLGLDDPFDERAVLSAKEMKDWEESCFTCKNDPLPLVIFIRTESATSLLKSKSAVEQLLQECTSVDSIHLVVLGKGIDATTETLPVEDYDSEMSSPLQSSSDSLTPPPMQQTQNGPWFGFSPQNQNASGQNDPEGSRRFNIFLARTTDRNGTPGILGAIAPPQAGNLFPHMMALQARERLQDAGRLPPPTDENVPSLSNQLEQWSQLLQQQMQNQGRQPFPSPQFFNATLVSPQQQNPFQPQQPNAQPQQQQLPPEVVQHALQHAMSDLLDRLAQMSEDGDSEETPSELHPDLHRAFGQVLRNENLRRGIAENLARAAPALTDPKCQGVMLSVYVPPPPHHANSGKLPGQAASPQQQQPPASTPSNKQGGWFHKILNSAEQHVSNNNDALDEANQAIEDDGSSSSSKKRSSRKNRVRSLAAASGALGLADSEESDDLSSKSLKMERNLQKLETLCRHIPVKTPTDPVRRKSWEAWIARERGSVVFRQNRKALNAELQHRRLQLQEKTGTRGVGSSLRQMLSVRNVSDEMQDVIKCAVELEAAKSQRHEKTKTSESSEKEVKKEKENFEIDVSLHQLLVNDDGESTDSLSMEPAEQTQQNLNMQYLHPSSLESALALTCRLNPSPSGGLSLSSSSTPASHRSREDILALAQDKHERALISQVVSPQDIGVTYDMIGGLTNVKELLRQSITYPLKFPHLYSEGIAREAVKGVLLFGPPGTGKTMLAKAVATEGGASFLSVDASSVENKWLGESEKNAKAVFTLARRLAPCVIFIDEVDSLLSSREGSSDDSAHGTLTSVKTTMMSEWDGLNSGTNGNGEAGSDRVVVIGSTNRPFDLDEAVLRRFPRRILVDLPDLETRTEILEVTLAENRLDPSVNLTLIAERLEGYTGSDIKEVCREAVVQISHEQARLADQGALESADFTQGSLQRLRPVTMEDFEMSLSKLKRSVSERGRELSRVWEWNDEYGEIKREKRDHLPQLMNMFL